MKNLIWNFKENTKKRIVENTKCKYQSSHFCYVKEFEIKKSHPSEEEEKLPPFTSCHIHPALGGRTQSLLTIAFSKDGEGGHIIFSNKYINLNYVNWKACVGLCNAIIHEVKLINSENHTHVKKLRHYINYIIPGDGTDNITNGNNHSNRQGGVILWNYFES